MDEDAIAENRSPHGKALLESSAEPRYQLWKALGKEVRDNPLRCSLAFIQTLVLFFGGLFFLVNTWNPSASEVSLNEVLALRNGKEPAEVQVFFYPVGEHAILNVTVSAVGKFLSAKQPETSQFSIMNNGAIGQSMQASLKFSQFPSSIELCVSVTNIKSVKKNQLIIVDYDERSYFNTENFHKYVRLDPGPQYSANCRT